MHAANDFKLYIASWKFWALAQSPNASLTTNFHTIILVKENKLWFMKICCIAKANEIYYVDLTNPNNVSVYY